MVTPLHPRDELVKPDDKKVAELRAELTDLSNYVASMSAKASAQLEKGTGAVRSSIESQPVLAMGVAVAAGALLALAVMPKPQRSFRYDDPSTYSAASAYEAAKRAARNIDTVPMTSRFERVVDAISSIDPTALTSSPAYGTAKTWVESLVSGVKKATGA